MTDKKLGKLPISSLRAWRNRILSHIDKNDVATNMVISKKYPIKTKHVKEIINTLHGMLNEYCLAYDFSTHSKDLTIETGIRYVLDAIRLKHQGKRFSSTL